MPSQPAWFHRLDKIFTALRAMTSAHLDRQAVEKLFGVGQRRARQLMAGLDGIRAGTGLTSWSPTSPAAGTTSSRRKSTRIPPRGGCERCFATEPGACTARRFY